MSKWIRRSLWLLVPIAGVAALVWWRTRPEPVEVRVATVGRGTVESVVVNTRAGTVHALRRAKLSPSIGGRVDRLHVREGDRVVADQVLIELWNLDLTARLELARQDVVSAKALADEAAARAEWNELEAQRLAALAKDGVSSEEDAERAAAQAKAARAARAAAESQALVKQASLRVIEADLDRTVLRAPFGGVVAELNAELGEFVTPSPTGIPTPPAIDLIDPTSLYVTAPIDEVDAPSVQIDKPVRITLDAFPGRTFQGRVRRIAPYVLDREKQARTVDVEARFDDPGDAALLLPGYSADVAIVLEQRHDVLRIPTEAIRDGKRVWVLESRGMTLAERTIQTGLANWSETEVLAGLEPGEQVVVGGSHDLAAGTPAVRAPDTREP